MISFYNVATGERDDDGTSHFYRASLVKYNFNGSANFINAFQIDEESGEGIIYDI